MTPGEILSHPWRIDVRALPPYYKGLLSAWVAVDGGFYVPEDTLVVTSTTAYTLSSRKTIFGSQAASKMSLRSTVLSAGLALTCHDKLRMGLSVQGIVWQYLLAWLIFR